MGPLHRYQPRSSTQLLARILDHPQLVAAVSELPAPVLATLIDRVGLEDAGELVAVATSAQLERVLDQDVWRAEAPGQDEHFAPERFALWLSVMLEAGEDEVARRLSELPADLLTLAVHRLVRVASAYDPASGADRGDDEDEGAACEAWEEFTLTARDRDNWDVVWTCLLALDREHHDLLRLLLGRCCALDAEAVERDGLHDVLTSGEMLANDVAAERDDRRSGGGYVSAADARSFLELARRGGDTRTRDPITRAYFRALEDTHGPAPASSAGQRPPTERAAPGRLAAARSDLPALIDVLRTAEVLSSPAAPAVAALPSDAAEQPRPPTLLDAAMSDLGATRPLVFAARVEELGYLANVLIAAGSHAGRALGPVEALEAAIAICNVGFEDAVGAEPSPASAVAVLARTPADRLFRDGYRTLHVGVILRAQAELCRLCTAQHRGDLIARMRDAWARGTAFVLHTAIDAEGLGLDDASFTALLALTETCPWLSRPARRGSLPFIAGHEDMRVAQALCAGLAGRSGAA